MKSYRASRRVNRSLKGLCQNSKDSKENVTGSWRIDDLEVEMVDDIITFSNKENRGWAQWLPPIISALWETEAGGSLEEFKTSLANMVKPRLY